MESPNEAIRPSDILKLNHIKLERQELNTPRTYALTLVPRELLISSGDVLVNKRRTKEKARKREMQTKSGMKTKERRSTKGVLKVKKERRNKVAKQPPKRLLRGDVPKMGRTHDALPKRAQTRVATCGPDASGPCAHNKSASPKGESRPEKVSSAAQHLPKEETPDPVTLVSLTDAVGDTINLRALSLYSMVLGIVQSDVKLKPLNLELLNLFSTVPDSDTLDALILSQSLRLMMPGQDNLTSFELDLLTPGLVSPLSLSPGRLTPIQMMSAPLTPELMPISFESSLVTPDSLTLGSLTPGLISPLSIKPSALLSDPEEYHHRQQRLIAPKEPYLLQEVPERESDFFAIYHMLQTVYSPHLASDYTTFEDYIAQCSENSDTAAEPRSQPLYPLRKDPRLVRVSRSLSCSDLESGMSVTVKTPKRRLFMVVLRFQQHREYVAVMALSGPEQEYKLPIFSDLIPFRLLLVLPEYQATSELTDSHVEVMNGCGFSGVAIKRYESRLTMAQMTIILGLQNYTISLTKHIEAAIFVMLEQLCGFRVGERTWCRGFGKKERRDIIARVTRFMHVYFPMLSPELVEIIIKRGSYARTQKFLRRRRNLRKHR